MALSLNESGFILQDGQCLFEASDLCLAPPRSLSISLRLRNAAILDLAVIIEHCTQLSTRCLTVSGVLGHSGILRFSLLCAVLDILVFQRLCDSVFLTHPLILGLSVCLLSLFLCQICGKI